MLANVYCEYAHCPFLLLQPLLLPPQQQLLIQLQQLQQVLLRMRPTFIGSFSVRLLRAYESLKVYLTVR